MRKFCTNCTVILLVSVYECGASNNIAFSASGRQSDGFGAAEQPLPMNGLQRDSELSNTNLLSLKEAEQQYLKDMKGFLEFLTALGDLEPAKNSENTDSKKCQEKREKKIEKISDYLSWSKMKKCTKLFKEKLVAYVNNKPDEKNPGGHEANKLINPFIEIEKFFRSASCYCQTICGITKELGLEEFRNELKRREEQENGVVLSLEEFKRIHDVLVEVAYGVQYMYPVSELARKGICLDSSGTPSFDFVKGKGWTVSKIKFDWLRERGNHIIDLIWGIERSLLIARSKHNVFQWDVRDVTESTAYNADYLDSLKVACDEAFKEVFYRSEPEYIESSWRLWGTESDDELDKTRCGLERYLECLLVYVQQTLGLESRCLSLSDSIKLFESLENQNIGTKHVSHRCDRLKKDFGKIKIVLESLKVVNAYKKSRTQINPEGVSKLLSGISYEDETLTQYVSVLDRFEEKIKGTTNGKPSSNLEAPDGTNVRRPGTLGMAENPERQQKRRRRKEDLVVGNDKKKKRGNKVDDEIEDKLRRACAKCHEIMAEFIGGRNLDDFETYNYSEQELENKYIQIENFFKQYIEYCKTLLSLVYHGEIQMRDFKDLKDFLYNMEFNSDKFDKLDPAYNYEVCELFSEMMVIFQYIKRLLEHIKDMEWFKDPYELDKMDFDQINNILVNAERYFRTRFYRRNIMEPVEISGDIQTDYLRCVWEACHRSCESFTFGKSLDAFVSLLQNCSDDDLMKKYVQLREIFDSYLFYCQRLIGLERCTHLGGMRGALEDISDESRIEGGQRLLTYLKVLGTFSDITTKLTYLEELQNELLKRGIAIPTELAESVLDDFANNVSYSANEIKGILERCCNYSLKIINASFMVPDLNNTDVGKEDDIDRIINIGLRNGLTRENFERWWNEQTASGLGEPDSGRHDELERLAERYKGSLIESFMGCILSRCQEILGLNADYPLGANALFLLVKYLIQNRRIGPEVCLKLKVVLDDFQKNFSYIERMNNLFPLSYEASSGFPQYIEETSSAFNKIGVLVEKFSQNHASGIVNPHLITPVQPAGGFTTQLGRVENSDAEVEQDYDSETEIQPAWGSTTRSGRVENSDTEVEQDDDSETEIQPAGGFTTQLGRVENSDTEVEQDYDSETEIQPAWGSTTQSGRVENSDTEVEQDYDSETEIQPAWGFTTQLGRVENSDAEVEQDDDSETEIQPAWGFTTQLGRVENSDTEAEQDDDSEASAQFGENTEIENINLSLFPF